MEDDNVVGQLGGFALNEVFRDLGIDADGLSSVQNQIGVRTNGAAFSRDSIYSSKFVDDQLDDGEEYDPRADLEAEIDREMYDEKFLDEGPKQAAAGGQKLMRGEEDDFDEDDDDEEQPGQSAGQVKQEPRDDADDRGLFGDRADQHDDAARDSNMMSVEPIPQPAAVKQVDVKELFPTFEPGKTLDFTDLFAIRPRKRQRVFHEATKLVLPAPDELSRARSTRDALVAPLRPSRRDNRLRNLLMQSQERDGEEWEDDESSDEELIRAIEESNGHAKNKWIVPVDRTEFDMAELDDWESNIVWTSNQQPTHIVSGNLLAPRNAEFENGTWLKGIIWDGSRPRKDFAKLNLNLNDTQMLLELDQSQTETAPQQPLGGDVEREEGLDLLNISNDKEYEIKGEVKKVIRQTFGLLEVQHAYPAQKLQLPFYKTKLNKADLRAFHRPPIQFPANVPLTFSKNRSAKKRKDKQGRKIKRGDGDAFRYMTDITLKDTSPFILYEFSEENPPIISNVGMGSILVNYYRKRTPEDPFVPQLDLGEPFLLEGTDESPFKVFGHVHPGQTVPTLYNNLIRAPVFRQKASDTDFLVARVTINGESQYYIREIKNMFVVGQTYPLTEVPGPHSRKVTTLQKNRLQAIAFKLVAKNPRHRIKVHRLTRYFPDQNDLQMRQRLKEFMEFNRKGPDQGFWMIKKTIAVPDESEMLKLATPEMVCLAESMQVGLRNLQDAGYTAGAEDVGKDDDDSKLDIEQQLAPWITTKNFINATANKAMLKLHGEGDPTGRGEAFSFLRVSMKDIFLRAGEAMEDRLAEMANRPKSAHRYNVQEQQEVYKEEIARIWKAQWDALSNPVPPQLTEEDERRARAPARGRRTDTPAAGTPRNRMGTPGSRDSSPDRDDNMSTTSGRPNERSKTLRIKRLVAGRWETEIVKDQAVIGAYVRQRKTIDEEKQDADELLPSDDESKNERARKRLKEQLEKLKRNQERRLARKNQKLGIPIGAIGVGGKRAVKTETTRVCGNCGQRGHMKTSKKLCPRWHEFNAPKAAEPSNALPTNFGGGLALPSMGAAPAPVQLAPKPVAKPKPAPKKSKKEKDAEKAAAAAGSGGGGAVGTPAGGASSPPADPSQAGTPILPLPEVEMF